MQKALVILLIVSIMACREAEYNRPNAEIEQTEKQTPIQPQVDIEAAPEKPRKNTPSRHYEYFLVGKHDGAPYTESPNGEVLGIFPLNTSLKILKHTNIMTQDAVEKGEWLAVAYENDTVYVNSKLLSNRYTYAGLKIYTASPYYVEENSTRTAFVNLSQAHPDAIEDNEETFEPMLTTANLAKDTIILNHQQRKEFLKRLNLAESDHVFLYQLSKATVMRFKVADLPVIACINIYAAYGDYQRREEDYEFGFDLGKHYTGNHENFVYVGQKNPFQSGDLTPMSWKKVANAQFPIDLKRDSTATETYRYSLSKYDYFLQKPQERAASYHVVVWDKELDSLVFDRHYQSSEGIYLMPLNNTEMQSQYTGTVFTGKPPILYGFTSHSFGCPFIEFIDQTQPPVLILCDNRH